MTSFPSLCQRCTSEILALTDPTNLGDLGLGGGVATLGEPKVSWEQEEMEVVPEESQKIR